MACSRIKAIALTWDCIGSCNRVAFVFLFFKGLIMIFEFECGDCLTECSAEEDVCVCCGADLSNEVDASDYDHDDDDGQPSELQEWHDFDPDC